MTVEIVKRKQRIEITTFRRQLSVYCDTLRAKDADAPRQTQDPAEPAQRATLNHQAGLADFVQPPELTRLIETMLEANDPLPAETQQSNDYWNWALRQLALALRRFRSRFKFSPRNSLPK